MNARADLVSEAFVLHVRPGRAAEYRRRHEAVWPELAEALLAGGIVRYELYLDEASGRVFAYVLRAADAPPPATEPPVVLRWRRAMADVLEMDGDRPRRDPLERVFRLEA